METNLLRQSRSVVYWGWDGGTGTGGREKIQKKKTKHKQTFGGNGDVHDSDGSSSFTGVCMCHN